MESVLECRLIHCKLIASFHGSPPHERTLIFDLCTRGKYEVQRSTINNILCAEEGEPGDEANKLVPLLYM